MFIFLTYLVMISIYAGHPYRRASLNSKQLKKKEIRDIAPAPVLSRRDRAPTFVNRALFVFLFETRKPPVEICINRIPVTTPSQPMCRPFRARHPC